MGSSCSNISVFRQWHLSLRRPSHCGFTRVELFNTSVALPPRNPLRFNSSDEQKEYMVAHMGARFGRSLRTAFCDSCMEITVQSNGGAQEHQPNRLGRFTRDGSLWENMVPFWTADNAQHITPDPMSNPVIYYLKWVVSETVGGFNAGLMNDDYTDGIICPYEIPDQWQYEYDRQWFVDPTLRFVCTKFRDAEEA